MTIGGLINNIVIEVHIFNHYCNLLYLLICKEPSETKMLHDYRVKRGGIKRSIEEA